MLKQLAEERNVAFLSLSPESPFEANTKKTPSHSYKTRDRIHRINDFCLFFRHYSMFVNGISASFAKK